MSVSNINPVAGAASSSLGGSLGDSLPWNTNAGTLPSWFNDIVPSSWLNPSGDPGDDILSRLSRMVQWMSEHPDNINAASVFLQFTSNLLNDPSLTSAQIGQIAGYLNDPNLQIVGASGNLRGILEQIINQEYQLYFFQNPTCGVAGLTTFLQQIDAMFPKGLGLGVNSYINGTLIPGLPVWIASNTLPNGPPIYTFEQACTAMSDNWGNGTLNWDVGAWTAIIRSDTVNEICAKYKGDDALLILLMEYLLRNGDTSDQDQMEGYGATAKWLTKQVNTLNGLENTWSQGQFVDGADATAFVQNIQNLKNEIDNDPRAGGLAATIDSSLGAFLNMPTKIANGGVFFTVGGLCTAAVGSPGQGYGTDLMRTLNGWQIDGTTTPPPEYTTILNDFKTASMAFSDQSQVVTTAMTKLVNQAEAFENILNSILNGSNGQIALEKAIQNNISKG